MTFISQNNKCYCIEDRKYAQLYRQTDRKIPKPYAHIIIMWRFSYFFHFYSDSVHWSGALILFYFCCALFRFFSFSFHNKKNMRIVRAGECFLIVLFVLRSSDYNVDLYSSLHTG